MTKSIIGLKRGIVKLIDYNPEWKKSFEQEKRRLKDALGNFAIDIQHVGSTAISKILAKPIIDIGLIVPSLAEVKQYIPELNKIGYVLKIEDREDRLFFTKGHENKRTHYLHIGEKGNGYVEDMILFRDYLCKHKDVAQKYSELKKELFKKYRDMRENYTAEKEQFIKEIIKKSNKDL